jgi:hypothetical protein
MPKPEVVIDTPGTAHGLSLLDHLAVVTSDTGGLSVVDLDVPPPPVRVGRLHLGWELRDIAPLDGTHMVGVGNESFTVIDVSDPTTPTRVSALELNGNSVAVTGDLALVLDSDYLTVLDLSQPSNPRQISRLLLPDGWPFGDSAYASDVVVHAGHAIVRGLDTLWSIDLTDPTSPEIVGALYDGFDSGFSMLTLAGNDALYIDRANDLVVVDVTDPTRLKVIAELPLKVVQSYHIFGITRITETLVAVSASGEDTRLVDLSDPTAPVEVGRTPHAASSFGGDSIEDEWLLLPAGKQGLAVIDVRDEAAPEALARIPASTPVVAVATVGRTIYLGQSTGLEIWDISPCAELAAEF